MLVKVFHQHTGFSPTSFTNIITVVGERFPIYYQPSKCLLELIEKNPRFSLKESEIEIDLFCVYFSGEKLFFINHELYHEDFELNKNYIAFLLIHIVIPKNGL